jgi:ribosomal protein S18 acetylase RimI-like enzyme
MRAPDRETDPVIRNLNAEDLAEVVRIDGLHTGGVKPDYWEATLHRFVQGRRRDRVGIAAEEAGGELAGYLLGEVRAFEFGSEACGWVFAVGVDPRRLRSHVASRLLVEACQRFREAGIATVRTMVRRNDIPVLSFFRAAGFEGGSFVQLERNMGEGA